MTRPFDVVLAEAFLFPIAVRLVDMLPPHKSSRIPKGDLRPHITDGVGERDDFAREIQDEFVQ